MAATTVNEFLATLHGLTIAGVTRKLAYPPTSIPTADCPLQWIQSPALNHGHMTFEGSGGWPTISAVLIVAIGPVSQSRQEENFEAAVDMLDAVVTALRGMGCSLGKTAPEWDVRVVGDLMVGDHAYWAVVAEVRANG